MPEGKCQETNTHTYTVGCGNPKRRLRDKAVTWCTARTFYRLGSTSNKRLMLLSFDKRITKVLHHCYELWTKTARCLRHPFVELNHRGAVNTVSDIQYLCQMSWTSWCDVMSLGIHFFLPPHLIGGTTITIIIIIIIIMHSIWPYWHQQQYISSTTHFVSLKFGCLFLCLYSSTWILSCVGCKTISVENPRKLHWGTTNAVLLRILHLTIYFHCPLL